MFDPRLRSETAEVGLALLEPRDMPQPDDADLLALALGVARGARREACARAILMSERAARRLNETMSHPLVEEALGLSPEDRRRRVIEAFLGDAERAARLLAEGLQEGETLLAASLTGLRVGWRLADEAMDHDAVARFAEALMAELMERGAWEELGELAELGHRAADALDRPRLHSRLLAYEGAAWSRRGDYDRAARLWTERVALNRRIGNPVGEADALMDLAGDALEQGDLVAWTDWTVQAQDAVERSGRAHMVAQLWILRAEERIRAGSFAEATDNADRAMAEMSDLSSVDVELGVRIVAARVLEKCRLPRRALTELADVLSLAIEGGRPAQVAVALEAIGDILLAEKERLAWRCLQSALAIYRSLGSRRASGLAERVDGGFLRENEGEELSWHMLLREVRMAVNSTPAVKLLA